MGLNLLLEITPEELVDRLLDKRRLLSDQITFIIQGLEESVDEFQSKYDKIAPKYRNMMERIEEKKSNDDPKSNKKANELEKTAKPLKDEFEAIRRDLKEAKSQLEAAIRIEKESERAVEYWTKRANEGTGHIDSDYPDLTRYAKQVRDGKMSRHGTRRMKRISDGEEE